MFRPLHGSRRPLFGFLVAAWSTFLVQPASASEASRSQLPESLRALVETYCLGCHGGDQPEADLALDQALVQPSERNRDVWAAVARKLEERAMPPEGEPRPDEAAYGAATTWLARFAEPNSAAQPDGLTTADGSDVTVLIDRYCQSCHAGQAPEGGLALDRLAGQPVSHHPEAWERVVRKLQRRQMPPPGHDRPDESTYERLMARLVTDLDAEAAEHPRPGRTPPFRRLTRTEYQNAIGDLLALPIDASQYLPPDESSHGFDNVTVVDLSPTLLGRYVTAAQKLSRLAVGRSIRSEVTEMFRMRPDITQDVHVEGLPLGTRGGIVIPYYFPVDGEYEIQVWLMRDRNEELEGLREPHQLEVMLDRRRMGLFTVAPPPPGKSDKSVDAELRVRLPVEAGPHEIGVTFIAKSPSLLETRRQPLNVHFNYYRHPRLGPAVYQVSLTGPHSGASPGDTPSRREIFVCRPEGPGDQEACARRILTRLMRRAYRRPIGEADLSGPMAFFHQGCDEGGFEAGIERALSAVLVSPHFLLRIERDPPGLPPESVYTLSDWELASRLSFFLWSSLPDEELLEAAQRGELHEPQEFEQQVRRMLQDPRASSLVTNFAAQWLHLRNLDSITPDARLYPDFDDNLRQAMRRETEELLARVLRQDRSVLELIDPGYTFLNQRLAKHYHIPHIYGSRFRRVDLDSGSRRGGILRHASILTVTSYATRTSPVLRGKWVLDNLLGTPPPPPPPDVPDLADNTVAVSLPVRQRLAAHRAHTACARCHDLIDPVGFAFEHFDAVGRWRDREQGVPVDATGGLPGGAAFTGVDGLEQALLDRPDVFVQTLVEKLLTFALGRGVEPYDGPAVRGIVRQARREDYRFSSLILGIAKSVPFQMRTTE